MAIHNSYIHNSMMGIVIIRIHIFIVVEHSKPTNTMVLEATLTDLNYRKETFRDDFDNSLKLINVFLK